MNQTLDITGLSPQDIQAVRSFIDNLKQSSHAQNGSGESPTPMAKSEFERQAVQHVPPTIANKKTTSEEWIAAHQAWVKSMPRIDVVVDVSRESF